MLYGREAECSAVDALLDGARESQSGVLVLRGEPGVGKSVLLAYGSDQAEGFRVLRATGIESESQLPFAGLHQLLWPVLDRVDMLHGPQAAALRAAFGLTSEGVGDRFLAYFGVLSLLAEVAEDGPLLCLVDDAQWLDDPSAEALVFASRRLQAERVVMLFAAREGTDATFAGPGLPDLHVGSLDREAAGTLLAERGALSPEVRQRLFEATAGNPLALVELAAGLTEAQLTGREALPERLVLGSGVERAFLQRVRELPDDTRALLVLAAADDTGSLSAIFRAGTALGVSSDALAAAESAGLVRADDGHLHFRHPLVRSAVYQGASFAERQDAHLALAAALDGDEHSDRRAWHRAAATLEPDAGVADELERTADRARARSGFAAAGAALERAAELSVDDRERARRYVSAAREAWLGGRPERARALLDRAEGMVEDEGVRAEILHARGVIENHCGVPERARQILVAGAEAIREADPDRAGRMLADAGHAASFTGDAGHTLAVAEAAASLPESAEAAFAADLFGGCAYVYLDEPQTAVPLLRRALERAEARSEDPRSLVHVGGAASYLGDDARARRSYAEAADRARAAGAVGSLVIALDALASGEVWSGRPTSAAEYGSEGLTLARETGEGNAECRLLGTLAFVAATQGREEDCRQLAGEALAQAQARGLVNQGTFAEWALGRLELGFGRYEEALGRLERASTSHPFGGLLVTPDLVEAAVRTDRREAALTGFARFERWAQATESAWGAAAVSRCRGLLAAGETASRHFAEAVSLHTAPYDRARTQLVYGEHLRRERQRSEARDHLRAAVELFAQLGAAPWEERARAELRATGESARKRDPSTIDLLTPQELQIARLVSEGQTNKEVAAQLFLSPRTIDYHLRKVFQKLRISSRAQLSKLDLSREPAPA